MKKKLVIVAILVLVTLILFSCNTKESTENDFDNQTTIEKNDMDSGKVIVEDEVTVDFGIEQDNKAESDSKQDKVEVNIKKDSTTGGENSEASDNYVNSGQTDNDDVLNDSGTSTETKPDDSENESEEPENPYDKDGDGYVDGWY